MKRFVLLSSLLFVLLSVLHAEASNKVVVVPLKTTKTNETRYLSIPSSAFKPLQSQKDSWTFSSSYGYYNGTGTSNVTVFAPVYLPQGAVITEVAFYYLDLSSTLDVYFSGNLMRKAFDEWYSANMISDCSVTTNSASHVIQKLNAGTIIDNNIDNENNSYSVFVNWDPDNGGTSNLRFYGCRIRYNILE